MPRTTKKVVSDEIVSESGEPLDFSDAIPKAYQPAKAFYAAADFEYQPYPGADPVLVEAGAAFIPPQHWTRDKGYEEMHKASKQKQGQVLSAAVCFVYEGEFVNPQAKPEERVRRDHRVILPLEER